MTDSLLPGTLDTACLRPVNKNRVFGIGVVETVLLRVRLGAERSSSLWLQEALAVACQCAISLADGAARR